MPVDVVGDRFGERPGDPQPGELPGPPVVNQRLIVVDGLVPALVHFLLRYINLDGDAARFRAAGQAPHEVQPAQVLLHLGRCPVGVAGPDRLQQAAA